MIQRLLCSALLGLLLANYSQGQTEDASSDDERSSIQRDESSGSDTTTRPLVAEPLPGASRARLTTPQQYVSRLVSFFSSTQSASSSRQLSQYYRSRSRASLLRMPEMFGDFRSPGSRAVASIGTFNSLSIELPAAAGISGLRIAENNQALPADRFWFAYNYFDNALSINPAGPVAAPSDDQSLHRLMLAREWLLDDGRTSIEARIPFGSAININDNAIAGLASSNYRIDSDSIGNLSLILKRLLYGDGCVALSGGLGIETPTGSSVRLITADIDVTQEVEAVHLVPFLSATERFNQWFGHAFLQLDIPLGDDPIVGSLDPLTAPGTLAEIGASPRLGLDVGIGYWFIQPRCSCDFGLAAIAELHLTTGLGDTDSATIVDGTTTLSINTPVGVSDDLLNATFGLISSHGNGWSIRSAVVAPLRDQRVFDVEAVLQLNRTF
ncbi:MAG: hypothetical protein AAGG48_16895 [Planctomycetota bacterium]